MVILYKWYFGFIFIAESSSILFEPAFYPFRRGTYMHTYTVYISNIIYWYTAYIFWINIYIYRCTCSWPPFWSKPFSSFKSVGFGQYSACKRVAFASGRLSSDLRRWCFGVFLERPAKMIDLVGGAFPFMMNVVIYNSRKTMKKM